MAVKTYKPTTPSRRYIVTHAFTEITASKPEKSLIRSLKKSGGRNSHGHITTRHRGGGHKRRYRLIDFKRTREDIAQVLTVEYDPNRSARISLIQYEDGIKNYILCPHGIKVGDKVQSGNEVDIKLGNTLPLKAIPMGTPIHNIELIPGKGGQMARGAGGEAQIMAKDGDLAHVKLPSGEVRLVPIICKATIGQVSPLDNNLTTLGKAGASRHRGRRPSVRGVAMNPVDHPHGGGEGKAGAGNPHPVTPWGKITIGLKTRKKRKPSSKFIVKKRANKRKK